MNEREGSKMEALKISKIVEVVGGTLAQGNPEEYITSVSTNSKEMKAKSLFVPIIGERVDAHNFIAGAMEAGAVATFTSRAMSEIAVVEGKSYILVEDTIAAMQKLAAYYRSLFAIPVIGVTGSVGKTTTKEMIAAALETKFSVLKTAGNMNSQVGLPLTIFNIDHSHEIAVIEMGMSEEGELAKLAAIARPNIAVVTNIGVSHIGQLGSKENIRKEKLNIINENTSVHPGTLYVNGNDQLLHELLPYQSDLMQPEQAKVFVDLTPKTKEALLHTKVATYGTEPCAEYYAKNISVNGGNTTFTLVTSDREEVVELQVLGEHNVMNACVAVAIAKQLGIPEAEAKRGLFTYQPIAMRGQIDVVNGITIIDDSYNASPDSMKSGINVLLAMSDVTRRIAVLADVLELGEKSRECHYEVGEYIVKLKLEGTSIDELVVIGKEAKAIAEAVEEAKVGIRTYQYDSNEEATAYLKATCKVGDALLVKGSRGMHTDEIVKAMKSME